MRRKMIFYRLLNPAARTTGCRDCWIARAGLRGFAGLLLVLSSLTIGCTNLGVEQPAEEIVGQRALAQAQALMAQDYDAALQYVTPAYREGGGADLYAANYSGSTFWTNVELAWVKCDEGLAPDRCVARIYIYNNIPFASGRAGVSNARGGDVPVSWEETWIRLEGQWFQYLR